MRGLSKPFPIFLASVCLFVCLLMVVEIIIYPGHFVRPFPVVSVVKISFVASFSLWSPMTNRN